MKNLVILTLMMFISTFLNAQTDSMDRLVRKMKKSNRECERIDVNIPGWLVRLGTNFIDEDDLEGVDIKILGKKLSHLRIVTIEDVQTEHNADIKSFMTDIRKEGFEDLMTVRSDGSNIRFLIQEKKDIIRHIVLLVSENKGDFVFLSLEGRFTMDDINKMIEHTDIDVSNSKKKTKTVQSED